MTLLTGKALVECANKVAELRGQPGVVVGYEEIAEAAFGKLGKALVSSIIYIELFGTCCVLFILEQVCAGFPVPSRCPIVNTQHEHLSVMLRVASMSAFKIHVFNPGRARLVSKLTSFLLACRTTCSIFSVAH